jgi:hypothetical protein
MKKKIKLWLLFVITGIMLLAYVIPAYADDMGISPRFTNMDSSSMSFTVTHDNMANIYVSYRGRSSTFLRAELTVKIEKKFLLVFWKDIAEWTSTSTDVIDYFANSFPADGKGTYRAKIKLTVYGTNGVNDVIEDTIESEYV